MDEETAVKRSLRYPDERNESHEDQDRKAVLNMSDTQLPNIGTVSTAQIDGLKVRYAKGGTADGIPVLLTAPWPESIYSFHRLLPGLGKEHPYVAVDLPGYGHSDSRPDVMSPEAMGNFVIALMKHFELTQAHIVAPDVGTLAFLFAASKRSGSL